jgi:hypothetical protein
MIKRKAFESEEPLVVVSTTPVDLQDGGATVHLGENASNNRNINLSGWLNKDIDDWVWAVVSTLRALERSKTVTGATIVGYGQSGAPVFFTFLIQNRIVSKPAELTRAIVVGYVDWLKVQTQWSQNSQKAIYTRTKSVLVALQRRSIVPSGKGMFPANPFPGSNAKTQGESVLSPGERLRLIQALREDLIMFHKGDWVYTESQGLVVHFLALAIRTGVNTAPLLELGRDSLSAHPWIPGMRILETFKRRGNATNLKSLRFSKSDEIPVTVPMDGVALLSLILQRTQGLAAQAPANIRDRVWLYRSEGNLNAGQITCLRKDSLGLGIQSFVQRHQIQDDAGKPLRVNLQRLRKTMENRLFDLSGGDLIATALIMGHTPQVADNHYLACTDDMRRNATFVGEALPDIYDRGADVDKAMDSKVVPIVPLESTPVGSCKDSLNGDKAPKNGTHCFDFFSCVTCRSYAIVGAAKDLHRLFSFYWFVKAELEHARSRDWAEKFANTVTLIDIFTRDKFDANVVASAKEKARLEPLKFWKAYQAGRATETEVLHGAV